MKWIWVIFFLFLGTGSRNQVGAAEQRGVYVSPPFVDVVINEKNKESVVEIEIGNKSKIEATFDLSVVDFGSMDETGGIAFLTVDKENIDRKYSLASWISLEKNQVVVESGKSQKIKVTILNKDSLQPGGHYGAVLATMKTENNNFSDSVGFNKSLATLIYVLKKGGEKPSLVFKSFEWKNNWLKMPKEIDLRFENNGNTHVVPRGKIEIKNSTGELMGKGIVNEGSTKILPESFKLFPVVVTTIDRWRIPGRYMMEIYYRFDGKDNEIIYKKSFIYVGIEGIILIFFGSIFGWIILRRIYKV